MRGPGPRRQATGNSTCGPLLLAVHYRCPVRQSPSDEQLRPKSRRRWIYGSDPDVVTELAKCSCQRPRAVLAQSRIGFYTLFDEANSLMQDLPDDAAEPIGDGPNGRLIAQSRQQTPEHRLEITAFLPGRSVGRLFSTRRRYLFPFAERLLWFSSALSSFLLPGTGSHPRGQLRGGGKRFGLYAHLGKQAQHEGFVTVSNPQPSPPSSPSLSNGGWIVRLFLGRRAESSACLSRRRPN